MIDNPQQIMNDFYGAPPAGSQGPKEGANHRRDLRRTLDLTRHPAFYWKPGHYAIKVNAREITLRYDLASGQWTAQCPSLEIKVSFPHQPPTDIADFLRQWVSVYDETDIDDWMIENLPQTEARPEIGGQRYGLR